MALRDGVTTALKHLPGKHEQLLHGNRLGRADLPGLEHGKKLLAILQALPAAKQKNVILKFKQQFMRNWDVQVSVNDEPLWNSLGFQLDDGWLDKNTKTFAAVDRMFENMRVWQMGGGERHLSKMVQEWSQGKRRDVGMDLMWALNQIKMQDDPDPVTLYRGMTVNAVVASKLENAANENGEINADTVGHWSSDYKIADGFAEGAGAEILFSIDVPREAMLWSYRMSDEFKSEREYVPIFSSTAKVSNVSKTKQRYSLATKRRTFELTYQTRSKGTPNLAKSGPVIDLSEEFWKPLGPRGKKNMELRDKVEEAVKSHFGHKGRPGIRGGSLPSGAGESKIGLTTSNGKRARLFVGDLTKVRADAIVNAANEELAHGGGLARAIVLAGGPQVDAESAAWVKANGRASHIKPAITGAGNMPAGSVIHAVGPRWGGGKEDEPLRLKQAYYYALKAAHDQGMGSIAFPSLSTGIFGVPKEVGADSAMAAIDQFDKDFPDSTLKDIRFVMDAETARVFKKRMEAPLADPLPPAQTEVAYRPDPYFGQAAPKPATRQPGGAVDFGDFLQNQPTRRQAQLRSHQRELFERASGQTYRQPDMEGRAFDEYSRQYNASDDSQEWRPTYDRQTRSQPVGKRPTRGQLSDMLVRSIASDVFRQTGKEAVTVNALAREAHRFLGKDSPGVGSIADDISDTFGSTRQVSDKRGMSHTFDEDVVLAANFDHRRFSDILEGYGFSIDD